MPVDKHLYMQIFDDNETEKQGFSVPGATGTSMAVAVVIPAYKCRDQIVSVCEKIPAFVRNIYVVDDCCPDKTGNHLESVTKDPRLKVIYHPVNRGVGGATLTGFFEAEKNGAAVVVKVDGDGQMDPALVEKFVMPILRGTADYTKGNRFVNFETVRLMPKARIFGNMGLSFMTKFSTGYWHLFDPTNGYVALHTSLLKHLDRSKISERFFFETDMLFRLNLLRAVIVDVPMRALYADEVSNLKIRKVLPEFFAKHTANFFKRVIYQYFLKDFNFGTFQLSLGILLSVFGAFWSGYHWWVSDTTGVSATTGTVIIGLLPLLMGFQLLLGFFSFDVSNAPQVPLHKLF